MPSPRLASLCDFSLRVATRLVRDYYDRCCCWLVGWLVDFLKITTMSPRVGSATPAALDDALLLTLVGQSRTITFPAVPQQYIQSILSCFQIFRCASIRSVLHFLVNYKLCRAAGDGVR